MRLVNFLVKQYLAARIPRISKHFTHPVEQQYQLLNQLVFTLSKTTYGKKYGIQHNTTYTDFRALLPICTYEELKHHISQSIAGQKDVLWPGALRWMAKSSGTTDASKYIPLSTEAIYQNHVHTGKDLMALYYQQQPDSKVFDGKSLMIGGSTAPFNNQIHAGDVSAILIQQLPQWLQPFRVPPLDIILMQNWEQKLERMVEYCSRQNVVSLSGVPSWMYMLLRAVTDANGKRYVSDVWPNLELFVHGGVSLLPYRKRLQDLIGKPINFVDAYNASEGFFAFQDVIGDESLGMWLHPAAGIFYEFVLLDDYRTGQYNAIPMEDVKTGLDYVIVISSNAGLWRYVPGDTVQFTTTNPYRIKLTGRTKNCLNVFGEELMVHNTDKALEDACIKFDCHVSDYTVAPAFAEESGSGWHEWLIEFNGKQPNVQEFELYLDNKLRMLNADYDAKRTGNLLMKPLRVNIVPVNTFYKWMKQNNKAGAQHKVPRLMSNRSILDSVMACS